MRLKHFLMVAMASSLAVIVPAQAQDTPDGQRLFQQRCASCHGIEPAQKRVGPHLAGVFGRKAGAIEGVRYSEDLSKSGIVWDDQTLNSYLDNPRAIVPRTTMTFVVRDAGQRGAIIDYLRSLPPQ